MFTFDKVPRLLSKTKYSTKVKRTIASVSTNEDKLQTKYDAVVIGGGHNGLVSAAYLAKKGLSVGVFERRHLLGGAAVTEEIVPGYKFSRASYVLSLLRPIIVKELKLQNYGLEAFERTSPSFTPIHEKGTIGDRPPYLLFSNDAQKTFDEIAKFSLKDAKSYRLYVDKLTNMTDALQPLLDSPMPLKKATTLSNLQSSLPVVRAIRKLGLNDVSSFYELVTAPIAKILNRWFESEPLKATLAVDGVIGAMLSPETPGSGYVLLHHLMGEWNGKRDTWCFVKGGMGSVSNAIAHCAMEHGAHLFTSQEVKSITCDDETCNGIVLADGREIKSKVVLSNATPHVTFDKLLADVDKNRNDNMTEYFNYASKFDYSSPVTKINVAVNKLPNFLACPNKSVNEVGEQHKGTIHLNCEEMRYVHDAYVDATNGIPSKLPMVEMCIPSSVDPTLAPPGHHVISLFTQYTPYYLNGDKSWTDNDKQAYADTVFGSIENYAPGFQDSIVGIDVLTPSDLEEVFGLTGGNIFHGAMSLDQLFVSRPTSVYPSYETPFHGLFLCGSSTHPGGGVMGSSGRLCSMAVLQKLKK